MELLFRLAFRYRPVVFERGRLAFDLPIPLWAFVLVGVGLLAWTGWLYRDRGRMGRGGRLLLVGLRTGTVAVLLFCLARPKLIVPTVVPQQNFLGILLDDSRSMRVPDWDGQSRSAFAAQQLGPDGPLFAALAQRFKLRVFRFGQSTGRVASVDQLTYDERRSDLARGLEDAYRELAAVPLAGLVVVTDGADNGGASLDDALLELQAAGVPVHTVGVGQTHFDRDLAIGRVVTPRQVVQGSAVTAEVPISYAGYGGESVRLTVEDGGHIVAAQDVRLPRGKDETTVRVPFTADDAGARRLTFRVAPQEGELVAENNAAHTMLRVDDARRRVLYFEGDLRWGVGFVRRALADDENVHLVVLQRTAPDKFLRLGVEGPDELATGFPTTRAELFKYDGLVLGSVEASFFTHDQLAMIADFVGRRGGGLLVLGGRRSLGEGGYGGTPVAEALPVLLQPAATPDDTSRYLISVNVHPTAFGQDNPVTQLASDPEQSRSRWQALPPLTVVNHVSELKPGAATLLEGDPVESGAPIPVLAYQRYGRGKALAFTVQDSWVWQMDASIPVEDQTFETVWRQLLRWLVTDVPDHVAAAPDEDLVETGTPVTVRAQVSDSGYLALNGARVTAAVTSPAGAEREIPMEWTVERDGEYSLRFTPNEDGLYRIRVQARHAGMALGEDVTYVASGDLDTEFRNAEMHRTLLEHVADATGGRFYTPATASSLPEDVSFTESGTIRHEERDLWDLPIIFLALVAFVGSEWAYRRSKGLA